MPAEASLIILIPVLDDWKALSLMLPRLARAIGELGVPVGLLIVDDGSSVPGGPDVIAANSHFAWQRVLRLRRNLGHQRAIAVGLCYVEEHLPCHGVIVMDGDGEDRPEDVPRLVARMRSEPSPRIVFGERRRRVEGLGFRSLYVLYQLLHRLLTGSGVRVGNFSAIPRARLESLVVVSEVWVHYAAAVLRSRQPWCAVPVSRDRRLDGTSRMNFVSLVVHGLSAISVYTDVVFTRIICASAALMALTFAAIAGVVAIKTSASVVIPGWAYSVTGLLLVVLLQAVTFTLSLVFVILGAQQQSAVIPLRDYGHYVAGVLEIATDQPG